MKHSPADIALAAIEAKVAANSIFTGFEFKVNALPGVSGPIVCCSDDPTNTLQQPREMQSGVVDEFHGVQIFVRHEDQTQIMPPINALQAIVDSQISPKLPCSVELADPQDSDTMLGYRVLNLSRISGVGITRTKDTDQWMATFTVRATIEVA